jgi:2-phosphoglycerate kinase
MSPRRASLRHVYWIGGGSGAGKSTVARRLADRHGLRVYSTDDVMAEHARRSTPETAPRLHAFIGMSMDERWVRRSPQLMLETFHWFDGEGFEMIVEDLLSLERESGIIVEGFRLLPRLVKPLLAAPSRAVWLLPAPEFRQTAFASRGRSALAFVDRTSDPERAMRNLLERDRLFTELLREETSRLDLPALRVDATMNEDEITSRVAELFGLSLRARS